MITVYPYENLGQAEFSWLKARHHFSFGQYHNPSRMGFGKLRVINDDVVKAGSGFDMHPHKNMEIITFVKSGAITHKDSRGNEGRTEAGDIQVMSAGKGIYHSEFNLENEDTTLFQIWIEPKEKNIEPRWDTTKFSDRKTNGALPILASGRPEDKDSDALYIHQYASISGGIVEKGKELTYKIKDQAYILIASGKIEIFGQTIKKGDGIEVIHESEISFKALNDAHVIIIDTPA